MGTKIALGRHGEHKNNILTPDGQDQIDASARWLAGVCQLSGITRIKLVTSQEGPARESGERYRAILEEYGLTVNTIGTDPRFNPARGLSALANGDETIGIPAYGKGQIAWWFDSTAEGRKPQGLDDIEGYDEVSERVRDALDELNNGDISTELLVAVFHGGSIEPAVEVLLDTVVDDLPSGALVVADLARRDHKVFDPTMGLVT